MSTHRSCWRTLAVLLLLSAAGCSTPPDASPAADPDRDAAHDHHPEGVVELTAEALGNAGIRTAPVARRVLAGELLTTGQVDFDQTRLAHVSPRISGRVHRVDAVLGQTVHAGQKLAEIDSIELGRAKAAFLQARAKEELARKSHERVQKLLADRIASVQEVIETEATLRESAAALRTAEETLHLYGLSQQQIESLSYDHLQAPPTTASIYPLRAPFSGTIVERHATLGELVTPERNLFTIADLGRLWIWADVYQRDLSAVHLEDRAEVRVDSFPDEVFVGTVSYLSARVDAETRTGRARLDVANPDGKLRPGMFVEVALFDPHAAGGAAREESLVVPESAVVRDGDRALVFVATGERRFERRAVRVGRRVGGWVELLAEAGEPLEEGDPVVIEGAFLLKSAASEDALGADHGHGH